MSRGGSGGRCVYVVCGGSGSNLEKRQKLADTQVKWEWQLQKVRECARSCTKKVNKVPGIKQTHVTCKCRSGDAEGEGEEEDLAEGGGGGVAVVMEGKGEAKEQDRDVNKQTAEQPVAEGRAHRSRQAQRRRGIAHISSASKGRLLLGQGSESSGIASEK